MGIASLIIGIISLIIGFLPVYGLFMIVPALIGFGIGIADLLVKRKRNLPRGISKVGIILNVAALLVILIMSFLIFLVIGIGG